jgi:biopolymer transport protein ExbD
MARQRKVQRRPREVVEINITAFMNLMVVLVPFLLMTAVFSHITVFDLNLPAADAAPGADTPRKPLELRVIIRDDALVLADNQGGLIQRIPNREGKHDHARLHKLLQQVKARYPAHSEITILPQQNTRYEVLVQVMDASRSYATLHEGKRIRAELFPDIAIGDAPAASEGEQ